MRYVGMLHRYTKVHFQEALEPLGLAEHAFPYLVRLYREDNISQDELTQFHGGDPATTTRALTKLEEAGFITRDTDAADRRVKRVRLTAKARELEPALRAVMREWSDTLTTGLSKSEHRALLDLLGRMAENARHAVRGEPAHTNKE